jgi:hypothetical protein
MELDGYVDELRRQLLITAEAGGDDARALAERLLGPLDATVRLVLLDALVAAAGEITVELAPGSVDVRLRGREPELVVTPPPAEPAEGDVTMASPRATPAPALPADGDEGATARLTLRLPEQLKARVETAAAAEAVSVNAWLARAAATALDARPTAAAPPLRRPAVTGERLTGWAR